MWVSRGLQTLQATSRLRARAHNDSIGHGAWLRAVGPQGPCAFFFPRSLYTLGKAYACKARSECDSVWASAPGIGQPGSASKPLWHREETLKTIHGYAT
jgi:hypothetical protein